MSGSVGGPGGKGVRFREPILNHMVVRPKKTNKKKTDVRLEIGIRRRMDVSLEAGSIESFLKLQVLALELSGHLL